MKGLNLYLFINNFMDFHTYFQSLNFLPGNFINFPENFLSFFHNFYHFNQNSQDCQDHQNPENFVRF